MAQQGVPADPKTQPSRSAGPRFTAQGECHPAQSLVHAEGAACVGFRCLRQSLRENALGASVRVAEKAARPQSNLSWDSVPREVGQSPLGITMDTHRTDGCTADKEPPDETRAQLR